MKKELNITPFSILELRNGFFVEMVAAWAQPRKGGWTFITTIGEFYIKDVKRVVWSNKHWPHPIPEGDRT